MIWFFNFVLLWVATLLIIGVLYLFGMTGTLILFTSLWFAFIALLGPLSE